MGKDAAAALRQVLERLAETVARYREREDETDVGESPILYETRRMHERHATEIARRLEALGASCDFEGRKAGGAVVALRSGPSASPCVRSFALDAEARLKRAYDRVLADFDFHEDRTSGRLLTSQRRRMDDRTWRLNHRLDAAVRSVSPHAAGPRGRSVSDMKATAAHAVPRPSTLRSSNVP